jgi:hypothetical protein
MIPPISLQGNPLRLLGPRWRDTLTEWPLLFGGRLLAEQDEI